MASKNKSSFTLNYNSTNPINAPHSESLKESLLETEEYYKSTAPVPPIDYLTYREPDGINELQNGRGVDNGCALKFLSTVCSLGIVLCYKTTYLNPDEYIVMSNLTGEVGILGPGSQGEVYSWKLLLSTCKVHNINSSTLIQSGPLKIVPVSAGTYGIAYDISTRKTIFLKEGMHVINDPNITVTNQINIPVTQSHITYGTSHIVRVNNGMIFTYRLNNTPHLVEGPQVFEIDNNTFEYGDLYSATTFHIEIDNIHRFAIPEGNFAAVIIDGSGRFITSEDRGIITTRELIKVSKSKAVSKKDSIITNDNGYIYDYDTEYVRAGNVVRIKIQATMVGIAIDGKGELNILATGIHFFSDANFKYYGAISSEQHPIKITGLRETAGDSGEATFDLAFAYRIDIDNHDAVKKVYKNLDKDPKDITDKIKSMVVQKALSAFAHCNLGSRQFGMEEKGISSITEQSKSSELSTSTAFVSIKDIIVDELMDSHEGSLKEVMSTKFGIILDYVGIEQIQIPKELAVQMQKQAIATASGRASVLEAHAQAEAACAIAEGKRSVLQIEADTDKALAETRAKSRVIAAKAEAESITLVGNAKKEALEELTTEAAQIMIAKEVSAAIQNGNTTLIAKDVSDIGSMMMMKDVFNKKE